MSPISLAVSDHKYEWSVADGEGAPRGNMGKVLQYLAD